MAIRMLLVVWPTVFVPACFWLDAESMFLCGFRTDLAVCMWTPEGAFVLPLREACAPACVRPHFFASSIIVGRMATCFRVCDRICRMATIVGISWTDCTPIGLDWSGTMFLLHGALTKYEGDDHSDDDHSGDDHCGDDHSVML